MSKVQAPPPKAAEDDVDKDDGKKAPDEPLVFEEGDLVEEVWKKAANEFEADYGKIESRMHRFPPSLRGLGVRYI